MNHSPGRDSSEKHTPSIQKHTAIDKTFPNFTGVDHRNAISKLPVLIKDLRELGYEDQQDIPREDVLLVVNRNRGLDRRTERKYLGLLEKLGYLTRSPKAHKVSHVSKVTLKTENTTSLKDYSTPNGWSAYRFGPYAPRGYQETLNPKYVPPNPPLPRLSEGSISSKNMCVSRRGGEGLGEPLEEPLAQRSNVEVRKKEEEEDTVPHTYILRASCPFLEENKDAVGWETRFRCKAVLTQNNFGKGKHRPLTDSEATLCRTKWKACPDFKAAKGVIK